LGDTVKKGQGNVLSGFAKRVWGVFLLGLPLVFAVAFSLEAQFGFGRGGTTPAGEHIIGGTATTNTNVVVFRPQNEEERRTMMLQAFIESSDEALIRDVVRMFNLSQEGDLRELRSQLMRYLGLVNALRDPRTPFELLIKDVFHSPNLDENFVVYADEGVHVRSARDPNSGIVTLRGDNGNLRVHFKDQTITARLIRIDMQRKEIFGEGNAVIRDGTNVIVGDKFYFNSDSQYGVIYNAETFMEPYFYFGKRIRKVGEKNYVLDSGRFTTCDADPPHYSFAVGKAWLFQDMRLVAYDVSYQAADAPIVWIPFFFHPMAGTGFWLGIAKDSRVGWFIQVENVGTMLGLPFEFSFDHYERLGTAVLAENQITAENWSLGVKLGLAYDKPLQEKGFGGGWTNIVNGNFDPTDDVGPFGDWKREWRWKIELNQTFKVFHDQNNHAAGSTSISYNFNLQSDPFFQSDFEGPRQRNVDLQKIWRQEEVNLFNKGSPQDRVWDLSMNDTRGGSSLTMTGNWTYSPKINTKTNINLFANDYYVYKKNTFIFPRVSYGLSGNILSSSPHANTNVINTSTNLGFGSNDPLALDAESERRRATSGRTANYSISYDARISMEQMKRFQEDDDSVVVEQRYTRNISLSVPVSFSVGTFFNTSLRIGLTDYDMWGETTEDSQRDNYLVNTRTDISESFTVSVGEVFNKGTLTEIGGRLTLNHNAAYKISAQDNPNEKYYNLYRHNASANASFNLFRTEFRASTSVALEVMREETRNWGGDRFSPINFSMTSRPFEFLEIQCSHTYSIKAESSTINVLTFSLRSPEFALPFVQKVSGLNLNTTWSYDYFDPRACFISIALNMNVQVSDLWAVSVGLRSLNRETYLYSSNLAGQFGLESRSFFRDLLNSVMFWNGDRLRDTRFYAQALTFALVRDLHNWEMRFDTSIAQRVNDVRRRFSYFDFTFVFSIVMKQNIGITFPEHRYRYTADSDGNYYGRYN
jgi:hypothetical protein